MSQSVQVTDLPQLVAAFHSLVGFAASATSIAGFLSETSPETLEGLDPVHKWAIYAGSAIGSITLTGSLVAFAKLQGLVSGPPLNLPGKNAANLSMLAAIAGAAAIYSSGEPPPSSLLQLSSLRPAGQSRLCLLDSPFQRYWNARAVAYPFHGLPRAGHRGNPSIPGFWRLARVGVFLAARNSKRTSRAGREKGEAIHYIAAADSLGAASRLATRDDFSFRRVVGMGSRWLAPLYRWCFGSVWTMYSRWLST